jgi:hypothetical protein
MKTEVRVTKAGPGGIPLVQVALPGNATPDQIAGAIKSVYTNPDVYGRGGLRPCLTCKSGIHVEVVEAFSDSIFVESGN